jgi:LysR family transcriptional activator for leuABCD operon
MVTILPAHVALDIVAHRELSFGTLAGKHRPIEVSMSWPRRLDNQPAHVWLRDTVEAVVHGLERTKAK